MRLKLGRVTLEVAPKQEQVKLVFPDELRVGDRVLVECVVTNYYVYGDPKYRHVHAQPCRNWKAGDQKLWTYGWRQSNEDEPRIRKVVA